MRPIRRKQNCQVTTDPLTGKDRVLAWNREEHLLSDEGSIDSTGVDRKFFLDCGCDAETGGQCFECGAISCKECHGRCQVCRKPICMQHSHFIGGDDQDPVRLCGSCADKIARKQFRSKVGRLALSVFFKPKEANDG